MLWGCVLAEELPQNRGGNLSFAVADNWVLYCRMKLLFILLFRGGWCEKESFPRDGDKCWGCLLLPEASGWQKEESPFGTGEEVYMCAHFADILAARGCVYRKPGKRGREYGRITLIHYSVHVSNRMEHVPARMSGWWRRWRRLKHSHIVKRETCIELLGWGW